MLKYCPICGHEHEEGNMPSYEEAMRGAIAIALYGNQITMPDKLRETYMLALAAIKRV